MKILKGVHIKEKGDLAKLVANITLNEDVKSNIRATAKHHFLNDSRDRPLYSNKETFRQRETGKADYYQGRRRIRLHTSEGIFGGVILWRRSLHARAKGRTDFVRDFYEILRDQY